MTYARLLGIKSSSSSFYSCQTVIPPFVDAKLRTNLVLLELATCCDCVTPLNNHPIVRFFSLKSWISLLSNFGSSWKYLIPITYCWWRSVSRKHIMKAHLHVLSSTTMFHLARNLRTACCIFLLGSPSLGNYLANSVRWLFLLIILSKDTAKIPISLLPCFIFHGTVQKSMGHQRGKTSK